MELTYEILSIRSLFIDRLSNNSIPKGAVPTTKILGILPYAALHHSNITLLI